MFQSLCGQQQARVAFLLPAIPQAHFSLWGAEAVGIACPVNYLLGEEHIAELLQAAEVNLLVALGPNPELDIWSRVAGIRERCPRLLHVLVVGATEETTGAIDFDQAVAAQSDAPLPAARGLDDIAALFHTGGTTGSPKLAQHQHRNQLCAAAGAAGMYSASDQDVIINAFRCFTWRAPSTACRCFWWVPRSCCPRCSACATPASSASTGLRAARADHAAGGGAGRDVRLLSVSAADADITRVRALLTAARPPT